MARNFGNFIDAYVDWADNNFSPRSFHMWSAISIIAAALERKVSLPWGKAKPFFPNMFVLLVAHPGAGKSSASDRAVSLLREVSERGAGINFMPQQLSQAIFIKLMQEGKVLPIPAGSTKIVTHSSGYYYASEASNGLFNLFGDFIASITEFYDCPEHFKRMTVNGGKFELSNVCFNLLAATTHDYLTQLVNEKNIRGGFASRLIYVVNNEKKIRAGKFQDGGATDTVESLAKRVSLVNDLSQINTLHGSFTADAQFAAAYELWYPESEAKRFAHKSESMQSLLVRRPTIINKLAMIFSVAESDDLVLRKRHWDQAEATMLDVEKGLPELLREAKAGNVDKQDGINHAFYRFFEVSKDHSEQAFRHYLAGRHIIPQRIDATINGLKIAKHIEIIAGMVYLRVDPNDLY